MILEYLKVICILQVSIVVDGGKKVVEFMFRAAQGEVMNYIFKNRELRSLFDRQWHKLGIVIQPRGISLYMDCNLIASRHTDEKDAVDWQGRTVITARASDGKPVDVSCGGGCEKELVKFLS